MMTNENHEQVKEINAEWADVNAPNTYLCYVAYVKILNADHSDSEACHKNWINFVELVDESMEGLTGKIAEYMTRVDEVNLLREIRGVKPDEVYVRITTKRKQMPIPEKYPDASEVDFEAMD